MLCSPLFLFLLILCFSPHKVELTFGYTYHLLLIQSIPQNICIFLRFYFFYLLEKEERAQAGVGGDRKKEKLVPR